MVGLRLPAGRAPRTREQMPGDRAMPRPCAGLQRRRFVGQHAHAKPWAWHPTVLPRHEAARDPDPAIRIRGHRDESLSRRGTHQCGHGLVVAADGVPFLARVKVEEADKVRRENRSTAPRSQACGRRARPRAPAAVCCGAVRTCTKADRMIPASSGEAHEATARRGPRRTTPSRHRSFANVSDSQRAPGAGRPV